MDQNSNQQQRNCVSVNDNSLVGNTSNSNKCQSNSVFVAEDSAINTKKEKDECALIDYGQASKSSTSRISQEDGSMNFPVQETTVQSGHVLQLEQSAVKEKTVVYAGIPMASKPPEFPALCKEIKRQSRLQRNSEKDECQKTPKTTDWDIENPTEKDKCQITPKTSRSVKKKLSEKSINNTSHANSKNETFQCRVCEKIFRGYSNRQEHEKHVHQFYYKETIKCSKCSMSFLNCRELIIHMYKVHTDIDFKIETLAFMCREDFLNWKVAVENETLSEYTLEYCVEKKNYIKEAFICRRNGQFKTFGEKSSKINERNTTGLFCPANMHVMTRIANDMDINVEVTYLETHIGHECGIQHNSLESNQISVPNQVREYGLVISNICVYSKLYEKNLHRFDVETKQFKCSECSSVFFLKSEIIEHVTEIHSAICMEKTTIHFKIFEEFVEWELDIEKNTGSQYVVDPAYKNTHNLHLKCHQSGIGESGFFCPARISVRSVRRSTGNYIHVAYLFTHLGHNIKQVMKKIDKIRRFELRSTTVLDDHLAAENISYNVSIKKINDSEWDVLNDSKIYKVKVDLDYQHSCMKAKCFQCNICLHQFTCTCHDSIKLEHRIICKHIHIICIKNKRLDYEEIENIGPISKITQNDPVVNIDAIDSDSALDQEKASAIQDIAENKQSKNVEGSVSRLPNIKKKLNAFESDSDVADGDSDCLFIDTDPDE